MCLSLFSQGPLAVPGHNAAGTRKPHSSVHLQSSHPSSAFPNGKRAGDPWNVEGTLYKSRVSGNNSGGTSPTVFMDGVDLLYSVLLSLAIIIQTLNLNPSLFCLVASHASLPTLSPLHWGFALAPLSQFPQAPVCSQATVVSRTHCLVKVPEGVIIGIPRL